MENSKSSLTIKKVTTFGLYMFLKYVRNIKENRKIIKSWFCIVFIILGGCLGLLIPIFCKYIRNTVAVLLQYEDANWLTNLITCLFFFITGTSVGCVVGNTLCKIYYFSKYKVTNTQYIPLNILNKNIDITKYIIKIRDKQVKLTLTQILNIDNKLIQIVQHKKLAKDRSIIKTAHERFREGLLDQAMFTHAIVPFIIEQELNNDLLSSNITHYFTSISLTTPNSPIPYESDLYNRITKILNNLNILTIEITEIKNIIEESDIPPEIKKNTSKISLNSPNEQPKQIYT